MVFHCSNGNGVDFLFPSYKNMLPTPYNEKLKATIVTSVSSALPSGSSINSNDTNDEHHRFIEYNIKPLRTSPRNQIVHDDREEQQQQQPIEVQLPPVQFLFPESSSSHYNHSQANKHQLWVPTPYPYSQEQPRPQLQRIAGSSKKTVTALTTKKEKQAIKSSSSTNNNSSNSKKKTITTSDSNNSDNNKDNADKKRRHKSKGQEEDNNNKKNKIPKMERPRWSREERYVLLKAILRDKKLKEMRTFHWEHICQEVGKKKKNCKDQWRLELLPSFLDMFSETTGPNEPSFFEEDENGDSDGDTNECRGEMYCDVPGENENSDNNNNRSRK